jgi:hypothetical protein
MMITKSHSEEDLKTGSANSMKGKKRVKVGIKMLVVCNVKNMFSASCHLPSINVTGGCVGFSRQIRSFISSIQAKR